MGAFFYHPSVFIITSYMPDDYLETKGELTGDLNPKKPKQKTRWWQVLLNVALIVVLVGAVATSVNVVYFSVN